MLFFVFEQKDWYSEEQEKIKKLPNCVLVEGHYVRKDLNHPSKPRAFYVLDIAALGDLLSLQKMLGDVVGFSHESWYFYQGAILPEIYYDFYMT
jgi:hypothetical protein